MSFRNWRAPAAAVALLLTAAPALAQTPLPATPAEDPLSVRDAKRLDRMEKVVRELRGILFQLKDTGKPVVVQPADTDARIQDLANRIGDLEQSLTRINGGLETTAHALDETRRANADLQAQVKALTDRLAASEQAAQAAAAPPPAARAPAPPAPIPTYRSVTTRSVTGKVVEVEGRAQSYKVRKGDTLDEVADKLGTTVSRLREDNGLKKRAKIRPGEVLKGPRSVGHAYVAGQGDTLFAVARRFGVAADALRDENDLGRETGLRPGQRIRLPEGYRDRGPLTTSARVLINPPGQSASQAPAPAYEAPAPQPGAQGPTYRSVVTRAVSGKVVEVEGRAVTYRVKRGDSLEKIARKLDTSVEQLREDNGLKKREAIQPGDELQGPRTTAAAYVAGQGDTLFAIARRFGVTADAIREENGLARNAGLRPGQKVRLPDGYRDHGPLTTTTRVMVAPPPPPMPPPARPQAAVPAPPPEASAMRTPAPPPTQPYAAPPPVRSYTPLPPPAPRPYTPPLRAYTPPPVGSAPPAAPIAAPTPGDAQISELGRGRFIWPLQGSIVSDFGPKAPGQRNDGINIATQVGTSVKSAAAGDVVYAGDQVPGFGNLVLIKHADGWVTAYGHLSRVLVKMQQKVAQGQEIGLAGATGGVSEPQLHFEVRYAPSPLERAKPIDPKLVLPR
ncbi:MAG: peptidase [Phenylobacterium sp.]|nr:peptidase [Phenylobacterium sp.]